MRKIFLLTFSLSSLLLSATINFSNINKEVENRIAQEETNGKKLTNKQKVKIEEQVKEDLQRGNISTDFIESTLGGETYNQLKTTKDNKTSIENKIKEYSSITIFSELTMYTKSLFTANLYSLRIS